MGNLQLESGTVSKCPPRSGVIDRRGDVGRVGCHTAHLELSAEPIRNSERPTVHILAGDAGAEQHGTEGLARKWRTAASVAQVAALAGDVIEDRAQATG